MVHQEEIEHDEEIALNESIEEILTARNSKNMRLNRYLSEPFNAPGFPIISAIFHNHPLAHALSVNPEVAESLVFDLWRSIVFVQPQDSSTSRTKAKVKSPELRRQGFFQFELHSGDEVYEFEFNLDDFRRYLRLPVANSNGRNQYDDFESNEIMFAALISLGYNGPLTRTTDFKMKNLPRIWYYVFSILSNCFHPYNRGMDNLTQTMLHIFYGFVFNKHYDIAQLLWDQLIVAVNGKTSAPKKYIPFIRFLSAILQSIFRTKKQKLRFTTTGNVILHPFKFVRDSGIPNYS